MGFFHFTNFLSNSQPSSLLHSSAPSQQQATNIILQINPVHHDSGGMGHQSLGETQGSCQVSLLFFICRNCGEIGAKCAVFFDRAMQAAKPELAGQSCNPEPNFDAGFFIIRKPDFAAKDKDRMMITSWEFLEDVQEVVSSHSSFIRQS